MTMLMGPVLRAELLRNARQRRYYVLRLIYGLVLLLVVWLSYQGIAWGRTIAPLADIARFASETFQRFAVVQLIVVLLLIPPVFGGAIADERQRKTLHYLMASRLSGGEIILDKVLGRSAHLAVFVAIGLPVVSLLGLLGGISAESVFVAYVGTLSTAAFAIALTVLISTMARRVRDAILGSYLLLLIWLVVPPSILVLGTALAPRMYAWIKPVNDWLADTSPMGVWLRSHFWLGLGLSSPSMTEQFLWMVGAQLGGAVLLLLLAIGCLRPTFRRHEEASGRRARAGRRRPRWFARPECGDDPILWKERYFASSDRFTRGLLRTAMALIMIPLAWMTWEYEGRRVIRNLWSSGFFGLVGLTSGPGGFVWPLQVDLGWSLAFWLLAVAGASASSVAIEKEQGTWDSLTATPLSGREILRGKVMGAIRNQRGFAVVPILIWASGLIPGMAHPVGVLASIAVTALLTWFVAIVGVYCSLRASSTSRALAATLATLAAFNGSPILLVLFLQGAIGWESSYSILGVMPSIPALAMASPQSLSAAWRALTSEAMIPPLRIFFGAMTLSLITIYAGTALALTRRILDQLDPPVRPPHATGVTPPLDGTIIMRSGPDPVASE